MKTSKVLTGILIGAIGGVLLGIIISPKKGSKNERDLAYKGDVLGHDLKDKFGDFIEKISKKAKQNWRESEKFRVNGNIKQAQHEEYQTII